MSLNQADQYEPSAALIALWGGSLFRQMGDGGYAPFSTRPTKIAAGEQVAVVEDQGGPHRFLVSYRGKVYDAHRSDFAPLPNARQVAYLLVNNEIRGNALEATTAERDALQVARDNALKERENALALYEGLRAGYERANQERVEALNERDGLRHKLLRIKRVLFNEVPPEEA